MLTTESFSLFLLLLARFSAALIFNPVYGRKNIPSMMQIGLALVLTLLVMPTIPPITLNFAKPIVFLVTIFKEIVLGYAIGQVIHLYFAVVITAGEIIDTQLGLGMLKIYDPTINVSMPISGSLMNIMVLLLFFVTKSHLNFIGLIVSICQVFPPSTVIINFSASEYIVRIFSDILVLAVKLALPIIAVEFLVEAGLAVLMRLVPQINIFVIGLQAKLGIGLIVLVMILPITARFSTNMFDVMFKRLNEVVLFLLE